MCTKHFGSEYIVASVGVFLQICDKAASSSMTRQQKYPVNVSKFWEVHVDSLTVIPRDIYKEFALAGVRARQRGQHSVVKRYIRDLPPQQLLVCASRLDAALDRWE